ncbi:hypothetical protein BDN72DRAFT_185967 [Pluteus cervinus]|uniref:Uncharacterized protein n=1 Tax=Pluteus cervinus TaxID=181527 RepID=A0ACD3B5Z0_9AGAR|nr:hypothetical protein BDN72DRAFT_185967 [Pluteus cervinus]
MDIWDTRPQAPGPKNNTVPVMEFLKIQVFTPTPSHPSEPSRAYGHHIMTFCGFMPIWISERICSLNSVKEDCPKNKHHRSAPRIYYLRPPSKIIHEKMEKKWWNIWMVGLDDKPERMGVPWCIHVRMRSPHIQHMHDDGRVDPFFICFIFMR